MPLHIQGSSTLYRQLNLKILGNFQGAISSFLIDFLVY